MYVHAAAIKTELVLSLEPTLSRAGPRSKGAAQ
jgi:hypothetical protein